MGKDPLESLLTCFWQDSGYGLLDWGPHFLTGCRSEAFFHSLWLLRRSAHNMVAVSLEWANKKSQRKKERERERKKSFITQSHKPHSILLLYAIFRGLSLGLDHSQKEKLPKGMNIVGGHLESACYNSLNFSFQTTQMMVIMLNLPTSENYKIKMLW